MIFPHFSIKGRWGDRQSDGTFNQNRQNNSAGLISTYRAGEGYFSSTTTAAEHKIRTTATRFVDGNNDNHQTGDEGSGWCQNGWMDNIIQSYWNQVQSVLKSFTLTESQWRTLKSQTGNIRPAIYVLMPMNDLLAEYKQSFPPEEIDLTLDIRSVIWWSQTERRREKPRQLIFT